MTGLTKAMPNTPPGGEAGDAGAGTAREDGCGTLEDDDALAGADREAQLTSPITATTSAAPAQS
jgi:hypothetical protein